MENRLKLNKRPKWDIPGLDVQVIRTVRGIRETTPRFDNPTIRINGWGTSCGRILNKDDRAYACEVWIKCNETQKEQILSIDWIKFMENKCTSFNNSKHRGKTINIYHLKEELYKRFYGVKDGE